MCRWNCGTGRSRGVPFASDCEDNIVLSTDLYLVVVAGLSTKRDPRAVSPLHYQKAMKHFRWGCDDRGLSVWWWEVICI